MWRIAFVFGGERASGVVQPACRPITSKVNTLVEVRLIAATSSAASRSEGDAATLTATRLTELDLPLDWTEQHKLLAS